MKYLLMILLYVVTLNANAWSFGDGADINKLLSETNGLSGRTAGLKVRTENTLNEIQDLSQSFKNGLVVMPAELSDKIRYGIEDVNEILAMNREGLDIFLGSGIDTTPSANSATAFNFSPPSDRSGECIFGSPCFQFREDVKILLTQIKELGNTTIGVSDNPAINLSLNLDNPIDLIDRIPGRLLYPLYLALTAGDADFISGFPLLLDQALADTQLLKDTVLSKATFFVPLSPTNTEFPQLQYDAKGCQTVIDNYSPIVAAKNGLSFTSRTLKIFGKIFIAIAKTPAKEPDYSAGYAGLLDVEVQVESNTQDSIGNAIDGLSDALASKSASIEQKIDYCASLRAQLNILDNQQQILLTLSNIQASSGASNTDDPITVADAGDTQSQPTGGGGSTNLLYLALLLVTIISFRLVGVRSNDKKRIN